MLREMTPIQGLSKAKRLSWFGPQNLVSYTYMKRLREHDDTRRVYDCDAVLFLPKLFPPAF